MQVCVLEGRGCRIILFHPPPLAVACQADMKQMVSGDAYTEWVRNFKVDMRNTFHIVYAWSLSVRKRVAPQQFDRPHACDCKIRNQSRIRADNKTCAYGYRDHNKFETSPSNSVQEFSALLFFTNCLQNRYRCHRVYGPAQFSVRRTVFP